MENGDPAGQRHVRFEPDDKPPVVLAAGMGLQFAVLSIAGIVLTPAIVIRAAGETDSYLTWAVFAAAMVSGVSTILQAVRFGRIGAGYVLLMGTSGAFIAVCVTALVEGGPGLLAVLVVASSLFQFLLAARLSLFRRLVTPVVAGTVLMLIAVTVMPLIFDMVRASPQDSSDWSAPTSALVTIVVVIAIALKSAGGLRLWAPVIGVVAGSITAVAFGLYDFDQVADAAWVGVPDSAWPGFDFSFDSAFWSLLPAFVLVTIIGAVETIGDSVAIQRVSWRKPRAVDYRVVQGAVAADGAGNLLSGLAGTMPNTTYSTSVSIAELTGVAARRVGVAIGAIFLVFAFLPKFLALVLAIPEAVVAAYVTVLIALLFVVGMRIVSEEAADYRKGLIAGVAFWLGVGFQNNLIFPEYLEGFAGGFLENGMTSGGLVAIVLTLFTEVTQPRRHRLSTNLALGELPRIQEFLNAFATRHGWATPMSQRLDAVAEETLATLLGAEQAGDSSAERALRVTASKQDGRAVLEFVAAAQGENIEDRLAVLDEPTADRPVERDVSLRLLQHYATSVIHQQYHELEIVTVHVNPASEATEERPK
ncbi:uracil-xanthine permease family protein [Candidatus Poriferisocius sp.]|uniref:uracil-xanthine permease family protein n=1 Tax=Candidatus Poriferisocius sp. TaxID=3101276 RepID=UPI003B52B4D3